MDDRFNAALAVVLTDLASTAIPLPRIEDKNYIELPDYVSAMLWWPSGSGTGVAMRLDERRCDQIVEIADQVQEMVIEELWADGSPTSWPPCPLHPDRHPLAAAVQNAAAQWICPIGAVPMALIGALQRDRR